MGPKDPQVIHVASRLPMWSRFTFRNAEVVGDVGPSLELLADRVEGQVCTHPGALLGLREGILKRIADGHRGPLAATPQRIVHDVRKAMPEDGIVCPRQRHVQDLVRAQLPDPCGEHAAARQCARDHGRRPAVAMMAAMLLSRTPGDRGVRRRRLHDEFAGNGNRGAPEAQSRRVILEIRPTA